MAEIQELSETDQEMIRRWCEKDGYDVYQNPEVMINDIVPRYRGQTMGMLGGDKLNTVEDVLCWLRRQKTNYGGGGE